MTTTRTCRPWTPEDLDRLRRLWPTTDGREVARLLGRPYGSCCLKASQFSIRATGHRCRSRQGPGKIQCGLYGVYVSDLASRSDRLVDRRSTRESALALTRRLNAELLAKHGRPTPGQPVPLAYCVSEQDGRATG